MNSREWNIHGWKSVKNPSGEMVRTKQYIRHCPSYINYMPQVIKMRKQLAELLQIPADDLMGELVVTIDIMKHKHTTREYNRKKYKRFLK